MAESNASGRIQSTISTLKQGAMQVAVDRAREEVSGWRQTLQDSGEQQLAPTYTPLRLRHTAGALVSLRHTTRK